MASRKPLCGVGINDAGYVTQKNGKTCPLYRRWKDMIERCYSQKKRTFGMAQVCEEWLMFSNFRDWMAEQAWAGMELDKDILIPGNKVYGPEACCFVGKDLNTLLNIESGPRSRVCLGVYKSKSGMFEAKCRVDGACKLLGTFDNPEAAHKAWQVQKAENIEAAVSAYSTSATFRQDVANALLSRAYKLRLDASLNIKTFYI